MDEEKNYISANVQPSSSPLASVADENKAGNSAQTPKNEVKNKKNSNNDSDN